MTIIDTTSTPTGSPTSSSSPAGPVAAEARAVTKIYGRGDTVVRALDAIDVSFDQGRFTAIMGPSGSGKSTLMHCLAGLDTVSSGTIHLGDTDLSSLNERRLTLLRRDEIGFVFQAFNLIPTLSVAENITLPMDLAGRKPEPAWIDEVVSAVGLGERLRHRPNELSGGQQQRVAVARALAGRPADHLRRRADGQCRLHHRSRDPRLHAPGGAGAGPDHRDGHP